MWVIRENIGKQYSVGYFIKNAMTSGESFVALVSFPNLHSAAAVCSYLNGGERPIWYN